MHRTSAFRHVDHSLTDVLFHALNAGDPQEVKALIERGADIHHGIGLGNGALLQALNGRDVFHDDRLLELLRLLVDQGVALNGITPYGESPLRVLSRLGRFDAIRLLLDAGADEAQLDWTPLIKAVALGQLEEVAALIDAGADLEGRDGWSRTAWLVAVQTGQIDKAALLRERGADTAAVGRCSTPALSYAVQCHRTDMLAWLLALGMDVDQTDEFQATALSEAAELDHLEGIEVLLKAGADVDHQCRSGCALSEARSPEIIARLLAAGADPQHLSREGRRAASGLPAEPDASLLEGASAADFERGRHRRFGTHNPERFDEPFWLAMVWSGVSGWHATERFGGPSSFDVGPVWSADRHGQSITFLPDGRVVLVAGEHEDHYDPDFCIYNDVMVIEPDRKVHLFGYPEEVFAPTDFHTATLLGDAIYLIGSLGYPERRAYGSTPVYRLDIDNWRIERLHPKGEAPGWIYKHRARAVSASAIQVEGGQRLLRQGGEVHQEANEGTFVLDLSALRWHRETSRS